MDSVTPLAIEYPEMPCHISLPAPSPAQTPILTPELEAEEGSSFPRLRKKLYKFLSRTLKSKKQKALEEEVKVLQEQNKTLEAERSLLKEKANVLNVRLAEMSENEKKTKAWLENHTERGTARIQVMLQSVAEEVHGKRLSELEVISTMLRRHEEVSSQYQNYKQAYDDLIDNYDFAREQIRSLLEENKELTQKKIELERRLAQERYRKASEQSWYGIGASSSDQQRWTEHQ